MKFQPKTDKELAEENILPEGDYPFTISVAVDETSKSSGLPMITLTVRVFKPDGNFNLVTDYLSSSEKAAFKLSNICKAVGLKDKYDAGELDADDFVGKQGNLSLAIQPEQGDWPSKNTIKKYLVPDPETATQAAKKPKKIKKAVDELEDEIPF